MVHSFVIPRTVVALVLKAGFAAPKSVPGSMEFVRGTDGVVRVVVQIARMPGYHEQVLVDSLQRKLRAEYGDPPRLPVRQVPRNDAGLEGGGSP